MLKATEARAPSTTNLSILKEQGKNTDKNFRGKNPPTVVKKNQNPVRKEQNFYRYIGNVLVVGIRVQVLLKQMGAIHIPYKESRGADSMTKPVEP